MSCSTKNERPTLTGHKHRARKRDEKEKLDPFSFRDAVFQGFCECGTDLDQVSKWLDASGNHLDYRRYAVELFDILFAGGILAPGGSIKPGTDETKPNWTPICVFKAPDDQLKLYYEVLFKLIRRYKYLEKAFGEALKKIILFLKGFDVDDRRKLAVVTGFILANGLTDATCLTSLFADQLVKEEYSLPFLTIVFRTWLQEKDLKSVSSALNKAQIGSRLLEVIPMTKRSGDTFDKHFREAGLSQISDFQKGKIIFEIKKELKTKLDTMLGDKEPMKEIILYVQGEVANKTVAEEEAVVLMWNHVMSSMEWNKKEEVVAEQAVRHLKKNIQLLAAFCNQPLSELILMRKVQDYCYDNHTFLKTFTKIIVVFYKADVLSEDVILKWYKEGHSAKGKNVFLEQMKNFIEWLQQAEEESSEEEQSCKN